jgi:hypothetical protein
MDLKVPHLWNYLSTILGLRILDAEWDWDYLTVN